MGTEEKQTPHATCSTIGDLIVVLGGWDPTQRTRQADPTAAAALKIWWHIATVLEGACQASRPSSAPVRVRRLGF